MQRLRKIRFDEAWVVKVDYTAEKREDGRWMCVRTLEQAVKAHFGNWGAEIDA